MGTLYLVDAFDNVLSTSLINDTVNLQSGSHSIRGSFVVNLPFDVPLDGVPADVTDLVSKKYSGMLASYPGYANIIYDEQLDSLGWQTTSGSGPRFFGGRKSTALGATAVMTSQTTALGSTPAMAVFRWELFRYTQTDSINDEIARTVTEEDPDQVTASVSFNGGSNFTTVTSGVPFEVPLSVQGSNFSVSFSNATGSKFWVGAWALIY